MAPEGTQRRYNTRYSKKSKNSELPDLMANEEKRRVHQTNLYK